MKTLDPKDYIEPTKEIKAKYITMNCLRCNEEIYKKSIYLDPLCRPCAVVLGPRPPYTRKNCDECGNNWTMADSTVCKECYK